MYRTTFFLCLIFLINCTNKEFADLIIQGPIYTMDSLESAEAMAIKGDMIVATGTQEELAEWYGPQTEIVEVNGYVYPGIIEGHGHFSGLGKSLIELNFLESKSWDDIKSMALADTSLPKGSWIIGRGWHQDKWDSIPQKNFDGYPYHNEISELSPSHPMILVHASGHGLFANQAAMNEVGISKESSDPMGGRIVRDLQGNLLGVFEERAMRPFYEAYQDWQNKMSEEEQLERKAQIIEKAQQACLSHGVTSFQDAGSKADWVKLYHEYAQNGDLDIRLWVMLRDNYEEMKSALPELPIDERHPYFYCNAIKSEVDGALGSYGAWLLKPYFDKPGFEGQNTTSIKELTRIADLCAEKNVQLCVHAIGDRANRVVLDMMEAKTEGLNDHRWRIEHAQHLHPDDIPRFAELDVIASMQSVHCTSDAAFVEKRLGAERAKRGAYAWSSLLSSGAKLSNGTDTPVEKISPMDNFYSAITRKYQGGEKTFFPEQSMTREQALKSMTIDAAYAGFEEGLKGSLTPGKFADFIILNQDILTCDEEAIKETQVLQTYVGGQKKFDISDPG